MESKNAKFLKGFMDSSSSHIICDRCHESVKSYGELFGAHSKVCKNRLDFEIVDEHQDLVGSAKEKKVVVKKEEEEKKPEVLKDKEDEEEEKDMAPVTFFVKLLVVEAGKDSKKIAHAVKNATTINELVKEVIDSLRLDMTDKTFQFTTMEGFEILR